jgi:O-antigen/teichoic acid export membrane protein
MRPRAAGAAMLILKVALGVLAAGTLARRPPLSPLLDRPELTVLIRLLASGSPPMPPASVAAGIQEFHPAGLHHAWAVNVATALAAVATGGGLVFMSWGFVFSTALAGVPQVVLGYRLLLAETRQWQPAGVSVDEPALWRRVLRYGLPVTGSGALFQLYQLAKLVLGILGPRTGVFSFASGILAGDRAGGSATWPSWVLQPARPARPACCGATACPVPAQTRPP